MKPLAETPLQTLLTEQPIACGCGRRHAAGLRYVQIGRDATRFLPEALKAAGIRKPFVVCDPHTQRAAMPRVDAALEAAGIPAVRFAFPDERLEPDERAVGALCMALDRSCDGVLAVGSGVLNDCCKVLAHAAGLPQAVVATAPSMDGYASNSASMIRNRVKVTLYNACPAAILADTLILKDAPAPMLRAGLGDMLAKSVALCEWRISHLVTGEYYCPEVAGLMRASLGRVVAAAPRLMDRDPEATGAVAEGLILSGVAMAFAQVSRPASGLEHYFSHLWEMFALERGERADLHGLEVGVGTALTLSIYDRLRRIAPDAARAEAALQALDSAVWEAEMRRVFGAAAQTLLDSERQCWHLNDPARSRARRERILTQWPELLRIMDEELPPADQTIALMRSLGMPTTPAQLGHNARDTRDAFLYSRNIRDKYLTSSLLWDLGLLADFPLDTDA
ncbi:MAG: sn-glycerol-1-phosphate dehydrogenase [Candidatus Limiplasma sp.]|nr:sn-glycerol-1-phosphate dehydrogenase [Candidatus Limiplasma sp.]